MGFQHERLRRSQAVAECFATSGKARERVSAGEMVKALEYFIVPQSMWPLGLLYAVVARDQLDSIADRIMSQVKADFMAPPRRYSTGFEPDVEFKQYWIRKPHEVSQGQAHC